MLVALYLAFVAAAVLVVRTYVWQCDRSGSLPTPVPALPADPLEIAFLRGGEPEVLRETVRSMTERELLAVDAGNVRRGRMSERRPHTNLEWALYDAALTPKRFREIAAGTAPVLASAVRQFERRAREERLLMPDGLVARTAVLAGLFGMLLVAAAAGLAYGARASLPIAPALAPCLCVFAVAAVVLAARVPRLTDRGRRYLTRLEVASGAVPGPAASKVRAHAVIP